MDSTTELKPAKDLSLIGGPLSSAQCWGSMFTLARILSRHQILCSPSGWAKRWTKFGPAAFDDFLRSNYSDDEHIEMWATGLLAGLRSQRILSDSDSNSGLKISTPTPLPTLLRLRPNRSYSTLKWLYGEAIFFTSILIVSIWVIQQYSTRSR